jgi:ribonucleotide reductase alpha subunit
VDFVKHYPKELGLKLREYGIRNCALLTIAPTGNHFNSIRNESSGIEPVFSPGYKRRYYADVEDSNERTNKRRNCY